MAFLPLMSWHSKDESQRVSSTWRAPHREVVSPCQVCLNPASLWMRRDNNSKSGIIYFLLKCWWQGVCFVFVTPVYRKSAWSEVSQHRPNTLPFFILSLFPYYLGLFLFVFATLSFMIWLKASQSPSFSPLILSNRCPENSLLQKCQLCKPKRPRGLFSFSFFFITSKVVWLAASSAAITHPQYRVTSRWCSLTQLCAYAMACWLLRERFNWDFDWNGTHLPYKS